MFQPQPRLRRPDIERVSFPLGQEFSEFLDESFVFRLVVPTSPAQVVVGEVRHDAPLTFLLVGGGVVLAALH